MPDSTSMLMLKSEAERMKAQAERLVSEADEAVQMDKAAAKIQAQFRGRRDRAMIEVKRLQIEFRAQNRAERDMMLAMTTQNSLAHLTDVKAMTAVPQHVQRALRRFSRLNPYATPASLPEPAGNVCLSLDRPSATPPKRVDG